MEFRSTVAALPQLRRMSRRLNCRNGNYYRYQKSRRYQAMHRLVRLKRKHFWRSRVDTGRDQASLWRVINDGFGRGGDGAPVADHGLSAEAFSDYFDRKVSDIRSATDGAPPPLFRDSPTSDRLSAFMPATTDVVCTMVRVAADKYSMKDPMPTWLLKT